MANPTVIMLTNDDGVDAPGLEALIEATRGLGPSRVFAPAGPQSGCGHVATNHRPISVSKRPDGRMAVDGTPVDCVRVSLHELGREIGWIFSGINAGGNLGSDLHHSGTVAAVREAAIHGIPGIAFSHYIARGRSIDWAMASRWVSAILVELMAQPPQVGTFWNVNLPHLEPVGNDPELVYCPVDTSPLPLKYLEGPGGLVYAGDYQSRARLESSDVAVCFGGRISVSKVQVMASS